MGAFPTRGLSSQRCAAGVRKDSQTSAPGAGVYAQNLSTQIIKIGEDDPTWPLYSATNVAKAAELNQFGFDTATAIITGRQPLSSLNAAIAQWKSRGGEQIRQEYQQSLKGS